MPEDPQKNRFFYLSGENAMSRKCRLRRKDVQTVFAQDRTGSFFFTRAQKTAGEKIIRFFKNFILSAIVLLQKESFRIFLSGRIRRERTRK